MSEIIVNIFGVGLGLFLFIFSRGFLSSAKPGVPSAAFFPTIISIVLMFLSISNLATMLVKSRKKSPSASEEKPPILVKKVIQMGIIVVLMFLYALFWSLHIGHFILNSIIVFVPISILISDEQEWWKSLLFSTGLVIFIYVLFTVGLKVRLW